MEEPVTSLFCSHGRALKSSSDLICLACLQSMLRSSAIFSGKCVCIDCHYLSLKLPDREIVSLTVWHFMSYSQLFSRSVLLYAKLCSIHRLWEPLDLASRPPHIGQLGVG